MTDQSRVVDFRPRTDTMTLRQRVRAINNMHEILKSQAPDSTESMKEAVDRVIKQEPNDEDKNSQETH